jgi:putative restriction endonuclease
MPSGRQGRARVDARWTLPATTPNYEFNHVDRLATPQGGVLDSADLAGGFEFGGERIPPINPQRGIFKPRQMEHVLSIKTVFPRSGARVWYDDQRDAHRQIYAGDDVVDYQFMGTDPN